MVWVGGVEFLLKGSGGRVEGRGKGKRANIPYGIIFISARKTSHEHINSLVCWCLHKRSGSRSVSDYKADYRLFSRYFS